MSKKFVVFSLLFLLVISGFAVTKLNFWQFMMDNETADIVLEQFRKENPDIDVDVVQL